jgi:hypothetical protein
MTRQAFLPKKFHAATLAVIEHANEIIAEYERGASRSRCGSFITSLSHDG